MLRYSHLLTNLVLTLAERALKQEQASRVSPSKFCLLIAVLPQTKKKRSEKE